MIKQKYLGLYFALIGFSFYVFLNIYIVFKLPKKIDTFLVFSWACLPGIIGGIIFFIMDLKGVWREDEK